MQVSGMLKPGTDVAHTKQCTVIHTEHMVDIALVMIAVMLARVVISSMYMGLYVDLRRTFMCTRHWHTKSVAYQLGEAENISSCSGLDRCESWLASYLLNWYCKKA